MASKTKRLAVSYSRLSDPKQRKGTGARRQALAFRIFCRVHNLTPSGEVYSDTEGLSGYHGAHLKKGRLKALAEMAEDGRFEAGTVVVIEAWDRLGRLRPDKQINLIQRLVRTGISLGICRTGSIFAEDDFGTSKWDELASFVRMAYQESRQKAERVAASWDIRKRRARRRGRVITGRCPAWLRAVGKRRSKGRHFESVPERVAAVRRIFQLAANGYGHMRIVRALIEEGHFPFGDSGKWTRPYVSKILADKRVLGIYQPMKDSPKEGDPPVKDGDAIAGYYPAVIEEAEFNLALAGQTRENGRGEDKRKWHRDRKYVNCFRSLLTHARDGEGFIILNIGTGAAPNLMLTSAAGHSGRGKYITFPYLVFEEAILSLLAEVDPREVLAKADGTVGRAEVLRAKLAAVRADLAGLKADLKQGYSRAVAEVLRDKEAEEEKVASELQEEMARSARPAERTWEELPSLVQLVRAEGDPARLKLRAVLRGIVEGVWVLTVRRGARCLAAVQVRFAEGAVRDYLIDHRPNSRTRPGGWQAWSLSEALKTAQLDLRQPAHVRQLEKLLAAIDLTALEELE
jgi:DNA invertase Pin-like site-specific DNA recombinase